ncbi:MAG: nucleoside deaminase [Candidatus Colwellbacteria bacterium]|nr:nucleoside deaminase [Candidatus Colwellbacteria bacterium]
MINNDKKFLRSAIKQSKLSVEQGRFPAGAILVLNGEVIASEMSDTDSGYEHAECRAVDTAFQKVGKLTNTTLYASMEPCLMCLGRAYWAGIRKIVFAISRNSVPKEYYEGLHDNNELMDSFNEKIELIHLSELEEEAIKVVRMWNQV